MSYRVKLLLFFLCGLAVLFLGNVVYSGIDTLSRLNTVEAERDQWQKPSDVIQAIAPHPGDAIVDLGCGSGYFTLKLSSAVGPNGRIIAEDVRSLPLWFLRIRTLLKHNVTVVRGEPENPHLPAHVDTVLIANTYHEFADPQPILTAISNSLTAGNRLVIVDRAPDAQVSLRSRALAAHEVSAEQVETDLRQAHFQIETRQERFIEKDPENHRWWLIVARKG